jgi:hypothetical protein
MSILHVHVYAACPYPYYMSMSMLHVPVNIYVHKQYMEMPDYPASGQSGTRMKKNIDGGTGPVPD